MLSGSANGRFLGNKAISINLVKLPFPQIKTHKFVQKKWLDIVIKIPYLFNIEIYYIQRKYFLT